MPLGKGRLLTTWMTVYYFNGYVFNTVFISMKTCRLYRYSYAIWIHSNLTNICGVNYSPAMQ